MQTARKPLKRCLASLVIREMQIKTTMKYCYASIRMSKVGLTFRSWSFHVLAVVNSAAVIIRVGFPAGSDGKKIHLPLRETWV